MTEENKARCKKADSELNGGKRELQISFFVVHLLQQAHKCKKDQRQKRWHDGVGRRQVGGRRLFRWLRIRI